MISSSYLKLLILLINLRVVQGQVRPGSTGGGSGTTFAGDVASSTGVGNSGYENNAATCESLADTPTKQLNDFWFSADEALYTIQAENYFDQIPFGPCQPPRKGTPQDPNPLLGAWYSINIPTPTNSIGSSLVFDTTFLTDALSNDLNRHHYIAILSGDCTTGLVCLNYAYTAQVPSMGAGRLEASASFKLETDKTYYVFVAFADNGNMDAPNMGIYPTCDDQLTADLFRATYGEDEFRKYCPPDRGTTLQGSLAGLVSTEMQLGNTGQETQDFSLSAAEPLKMYTTSLVGQVGILTCKVDPDQDNGDANLFVGVDKVPTPGDFSCSSAKLGTSSEECSLWIDGTSNQLNVLVQGTAQDIELSCWVDSRGTKIDVGIDMTSDVFTLDEGEIKLYHISAPQDAWTVTCSGNNDGMHILMTDKEVSSLTTTGTQSATGTAAPWANTGSCNATGTDQCQVALNSFDGGDVVILVEGIPTATPASVSRQAPTRGGNQLSCEVVMQPAGRLPPIELSRARSINLNQDRGFDLLKNQMGLYKVRVPQRATRVTCNLSGGNSALSYGLSVDPDENRAEENPIVMENCQMGQDCEYTFDGGLNPNEAELYLGVVASDSAFVVNMRCDADVSSRTRINTGVDMRSNTFDLQNGEMRLFFFDAPTGLERVKCKGDNGSMGVHMKAGQTPVIGSDTDCDTTGTQECEVFTSGGNDINILVEGKGSVSNGQITCELYMDTTSQDDFDEDDADDLDLEEEVEFNLFGNEVALFQTRVPQAATSVTCRVWSTSSRQIKYEMTVSEPNRGTPMPSARFGTCQDDDECKHQWSGGNPQDPADVYIAATTDRPARVRIRCDADEIEVEGGARYLAWGEQESGYDFDPNESRLFYLIVPVNANEFNCRTSANQGDLDLRVNQLVTPPDTNCECGAPHRNCELSPNYGALAPCNDCVGFSSESDEQCSFTAQSNDANTILYVEIRAYEQGQPVRDARVTCEAYGPGVSYRNGGDLKNPRAISVNPDLGGL